MRLETITNKISVKINYGKLLERYHIYKIRNSSKNAKEYQLFYSQMRKNIKPLAHAVDGKYTLVVLRESGLVRKYADSYAMTELHYTEIQREKEYILLRLLNSLLAKESAYFEIENDVYGLYYLVDVQSSKLLAINISIDRDMFLSLRATTFIKSKEKKDGYKIYENKLIKAFDEEGLYKKGNYRNKKSSYRFLGLMKNSKKDLIQNSKVYVLIQYLKEMQRCFGEIVTIDFHTINTKLYANGSDEKDRKQKLEDQVKQAIAMLKSIYIVNYTDKDLTKEIEELQAQIANYMGNSLHVNISHQIQKNSYNLTITYDEDYYKSKKIDDPYTLLHQDKKSIVQNITIETLKKVIKNTKLLYVLLKELVIKHEIANQTLLMPYNKLTNQITAIYPHKIKDEKGKSNYQFYKAIIEGQHIEYAELSNEEQAICMEIAFYSRNNNRDLEAILFSEDDIGYVVKSKEFPLPKIQEIGRLLQEHNQPKYLHYKKIIEIWDNVYADEKADLKEKLLQEMEKLKDPVSGEVLLTALHLGKNNNAFKEALEKFTSKKLIVSLKGKKENRHCIESLVGIRYSEEESKYYVGRLSNIPESIEKASPLREVYAYKGKNLLNTILPMLDEYFVKNGDFTVLPYPLKYVREYYKTKITSQGEI
ncbi:hypothetical protein MLC35_05195 [Sulfurimonas sp. NW7]|uniref:hypothetical protein n=1 Tax=Sulfurimonas sp. NW7 TaxID=2922727 RepID=UPI003DA8914E